METADGASSVTDMSSSFHQTPNFTKYDSVLHFDLINWKMKKTRVYPVDILHVITNFKNGHWDPPPPPPSPLIKDDFNISEEALLIG